jgi:16S rRNA (uracil1498-N3)-methyltransferase
LTAPWFIVPPEDWGETEVVLPPEESHHAVKVLRVAPPDVITVTDGKGAVARCSVARTEEGRIVAEVLEQEERRPFTPAIVVYQGAAKGGKVDDVVERLAELGVAETWIYFSERAVVQWDDHRARGRAERWRALARSAAKQSRNPFVMATGPPVAWPELMRRVAREQLTLALWEEASLPLRAGLVEGAERVALVVGPEGGFTRAEAEGLAEAGAQLVSLGPRILRTENAAVVATSALLYHFGLIG